VSFSGYPDFATIHITYVPDQRVVELKALKLYINSYRDRYISHEESVNQILDDFVAAVTPRSSLKGFFASAAMSTRLLRSHQESFLESRWPGCTAPTHPCDRFRSVVGTSPLGWG